MSGLRKNIVFVVMLLVVAVIGLVWYSSSGTPSGTSLDTQTPESDARDTERATEFADVRSDILANIAAIQAITLDTTILKDPAFLVLEKPERQATGEIETGRVNPFLPY